MSVFSAVVFISPVQFSVEIMASSAAAPSGPSSFRGSSTETEGAHFTETGKDLINTVLSTLCVMTADLLPAFCVAFSDNLFIYFFLSKILLHWKEMHTAACCQKEKESKAALHFILLLKRKTLNRWKCYVSTLQTKKKSQGYYKSYFFPFI